MEGQRLTIRTAVVVGCRVVEKRFFGEAPVTGGGSSAERLGHEGGDARRFAGRDVLACKKAKATRGRRLAVVFVLATVAAWPLDAFCRYVVAGYVAPHP